MRSTNLNASSSFCLFFFSSSIFRPHSTIWTPVTGYSSIRIVSAIFISLFSISKNSQLESAVSVPVAVSVTRNLSVRNLSAVGCLLRWVMPTTEQGKSRNINNFVYVNYNEALFINSFKTFWLYKRRTVRFVWKRLLWTHKTRISCLVT